MPSRRALAAAAALLVLAGPLAACGLRPLHGTRTAGGSNLGALQTVRIQPIADRPGQQLHNALRNEINPRGQPADPAYSLAIDLVISKSEIGVRKDETATRANLTIRANYRLLRTADQVLMTTGRAKSIVSYNIVDSEFGTYAAEQEAQERAVEQVAEQLRLRLAAYFDRLARGAASP